MRNLLSLVSVCNCSRVQECDGIVIHGSGELIIPPGAIATKTQGNGRQQYAAHPTTASVKRVIFHIPALAEALHEHMEAALLQLSIVWYHMLTVCSHILVDSAIFGL